MSIFNVYLPPETRKPGLLGLFGKSEQQLTEEERLEQAVFLRDGVSIWALAFPGIWLLVHRLWFWLFVYLLVSMMFPLLTGAGYEALSLAVMFLPGLYLFLEGNELLRQHHERQDYELVDVIEAGSAREAEMRFYWRALPHENASDADLKPLAKPFATQHKVPAIRSSSQDRPSIGLFAD